MAEGFASAAGSGGKTSPSGAERLCPAPLQRMGRQLVSFPCFPHMIKQQSGFSLDPLVFLKEFTQP